MIQLQSRINPQAAQIQTVPVYSISGESETCSLHPNRIEDAWCKRIVFAIQAWHNTLAYKPGDVADETAAGFTRRPTFEEARRYAANVAPNEPLPFDPQVELKKMEEEDRARYEERQRRKQAERAAQLAQQSGAAS